MENTKSDQAQRHEKLKQERREAHLKRLEGVDKKAAEFNPVAFIIEGINDRDAPSLYGENSDRDLYTLWKEKVELRDTGFSSMTSAEGYALGKTRAEFAGLIAKQEKFKGKDVVLRVAFGADEANPFLRMTADGYDSRNQILARIVIQKDPGLHTIVPRKHWIELQHSMIVAKLETAFYVSVHGPRFLFTEVKRDPVFCSDHVATCIQFWDYVRRGEVPPTAVVPEEEKGVSHE